MFPTGCSHTHATDPKIFARVGPEDISPIPPSPPGMWVAQQRMKSQMTADRRMFSGAGLANRQPCLVPTLAELLADPMRGRDLAPEQAAALLVALASVQRALELALTAPAQLPATEGRGAPPPPQLLTMAEAADRSRKSVRWIRDNWRTEMSFAVRKGRTVLFPEAEFERWLKRS